MNDLARDALRKAAVLEIATLSQRAGGLEPDVRENLIDRAAKAFEQAVDQEMDDIRKDVLETGAPPPGETPKKHHVTCPDCGGTGSTVDMRCCQTCGGGGHTGPRSRTT